MLIRESGASHPWKSQNTLPLTSSYIPNSHEWAMNNFSTRFPFQTLEEPQEFEIEREQKKEEEEEEEGARCEWDFTLRTVVSSNATGAAVSDALGVVEFDPSDSIVATGGIARKIRVYGIRSLLPHETNCNDQGVSLLNHGNACEYCICTPAKLSSLRWRPGSNGGILGSGDYDGVVTEYDLEKKVPTFERDEHGGRRVWSLDYAKWDPFVGASGSDDGTMQMWDPRCDDSGICFAKVQPSAGRSPVCCVEFHPYGGALVAVGCADRKAYCYDVRKMVEPVLILNGHEKPVSYVRFLDAETLVSAGTDGCLKLWNVNDSKMIRTCRGHVNSRSFVGLSVWRQGGLLCCGSENNKVFVYDRRWCEPIWIHECDPVVGPGSQRGFVSSVCWRQLCVDQCTLVAGGSDGVLQVFVGNKISPPR